MAGTRQGVLNYPTQLESRQRLHFSRHRSQAKHRGELYELTFEQYATVWGTDFERKGRNSHCLCLTRRNTTQPWCVDNVQIMLRSEHLTLTKTKRTIPNNKPFDEWEIPDEIKHRL